MYKIFAFTFAVILSCSNNNTEHQISQKVSYNEHSDKIIEYYDKNERIIKKEIFKNGTTDKKIEEQFYYANNDVYSTIMTYYDNLNKEFLIYKKNGKSLASLFYYRNGIKFNQNNDFEDKWYFWYENGRLKAKSDNKTGNFVAFYENGNIKTTGFMKDYEDDSLWTFYSPEGKIVQEIIYKEGKIINQKIIDQKALDKYFADDED